MTIFFWLAIAGVIVLLIAAVPYIIYLFGITFGKKVPVLPQTSRENLPNVSVVICAYNEERNIAAKIQNICESTYPLDKLEVIIVLDKPDDNTEGVAVDALKKTNLNWKTHLNAERMGKNKSVNIGNRLASHDIIIDTDADVLCSLNALEMLVKRLISDESIAAVCGDLQPNKGCDAVTSMENVYRSFFGRMAEWESANDATYSVNGCLLGLKLKAIGEIPEAAGADDANTALLAIRNGHRTSYENDAKVFEELPVNFKKQYSQKARRAKGLIQTTLANRDVLKHDRKFSKVFYPLRICMYVITPTLFFIGLLLLIIGLAFWLPILLGIIVLLFILITVFKKGNIITSFTLNQFYLLMGLYSRRKDAVIWVSTSKKVGEE